MYLLQFLIQNKYFNLLNHFIDKFALSTQLKIKFNSFFSYHSYKKLIEKVLFGFSPYYVEKSITSSNINNVNIIDQDYDIDDDFLQNINDLDLHDKINTYFKDSDFKNSIDFLSDIYKKIFFNYSNFLASSFFFLNDLLYYFIIINYDDSDTIYTSYKFNKSTFSPYYNSLFIKTNKHNKIFEHFLNYDNLDIENNNFDLHYSNLFLSHFVFSF